MAFIMLLILILMQVFIQLKASNSLCDPMIRIDSAFVDFDPDLKEMPITWFSGTTVYQLTPNSDPNFAFQYNTEALNKWSNASLNPPINSAYYSPNASELVIENSAKCVTWRLSLESKQLLNSSHNSCSKGIIQMSSFNDSHHMKHEWYLQSIANPYVEITSFNRSDPTLQGIKSKYVFKDIWYESNPRIDSTFIKESLKYLNQTTAVFVIKNGYFLLADNRVCRMDNQSFLWTDKCPTNPRTISQWIDCKSIVTQKSKSDTNWVTIAILVVICIVVVLALIIGFLAYRKYGHKTSPVIIPPQSYRRYKSKTQLNDISDKDSVKVSPLKRIESNTSISMSDDRPTELTIRPKETAKTLYIKPKYKK